MLFNFNWFQIIFFSILLFFSIIFDFELFVLIFGFFLLHISNGMKAILFDYLHLNKLSFFLFTLSKIFLLKYLIYVIELIF
uniref:succinate dehydrogenase subunit 4 n=1 Tax=Griffithsia okiensis TaxID=291168 RepID=UPI002E76298A|nr:succinate dehydrogenase subunit 4 [Griffithsia okiensis]WQF69543.1 succinate dehydrogenase subunit 4 [Griffithsia okiensis]